MSRLTDFPDPIEHRDRVIDQIKRWQQKYRRRPSHLLEVQLAALHRLLDRLDEMLENPDSAGSRMHKGGGLEPRPPSPSLHR